MKKYLVSYATKEFYKKQKKLDKSSLKFGIDNTFSHTKEMLKKTKFYYKNKELLSQKRGSGYWLWKPYSISQAIKIIKEGDILFYIDSGAEMISNVKPLVDLCIKQKGILLFNAKNKNKYWTKRDCFIKMNCDSKRYWEGEQVMGGYQIYQKNKRSLKFIKELLKYSQMKSIIDDSPSKTPNFKGFIEHRHDQSILTNLAIKYKIKTFRNPSQGGNHLKKKSLRIKGEWLLYPYEYSKEPDKNSNYPTIIYNKRDSRDIKILLTKIHLKLPRKLKLLLRKR